MVTIDPAARANVTLIDHPLVQHKLTLMRKKEASTSSFRRLLNELAGLMIYEVCRDMPLQDVEIETPLEKTTGKVIDGVPADPKPAAAIEPVAAVEPAPAPVQAIEVKAAAEARPEAKPEAAKAPEAKVEAAKPEAPAARV
jgi:hypothetical protein